MRIRLPRSTRFSFNERIPSSLVQEHDPAIDENPSLSSNTNNRALENSEGILGGNLFWKKSCAFFESPRVSLRMKKSVSPKEFKSSSFENHDGEEIKHILKGGYSQKVLQDDLGGKISITKEQEYLKKISTMNPLEWIDKEALPKDLVPEILAFAGPQALFSLSLTCKSWRDRVLKESVWRVLCEEMCKWKRGDPMPKSWMKYYCKNPCVPLDYKNIETLMNSISDMQIFTKMDVAKKVRVQQEDIRILLHPGFYVLSEPIVINAMKSSTVTIETMKNDIHTSRKDMIKESLSPVLTNEFLSDAHHSSQSRLRRLRVSTSPSNILRGICRSNSVELGMSRISGIDDPNKNSTFYPSCRGRATLIMKTNRRNLPVIRVSRGKLCVNRVDIMHDCAGTDIWNGNSALQIQPPLDSNGRPSRVRLGSMRPVGILNDVTISSTSGRGAVAIDGGHLCINRCHISKCAATGLYVGGPGSFAVAEKTDVLDNGHGNQIRRNGIARGHSGVYLEQGVATLRDCNVSKNSLTGISAISNTNAFLTVEDSDIVGNGTLQLEMPPIGSISWQKSTSINNFISHEGSGKVRSGLNQEEIMIPVISGSQSLNNLVSPQAEESGTSAGISLSS